MVCVNAPTRHDDTHWIGIKPRTLQKFSKPSAFLFSLNWNNSIFIMNAEKRFVIKRNIDGSFAANFTWVPALECFLVYRANLDKLGLLSDREVKRLTYAVYVYQERIGLHR